MVGKQTGEERKRRTEGTQGPLGCGSAGEVRLAKPTWGLGISTSCSDIGPCYWTKGSRNRNTYRQSTKQPRPLSYSLGKSPSLLANTALISRVVHIVRVLYHYDYHITPFPPKESGKCRGRKRKERQLIILIIILIRKNKKERKEAKRKERI